MQGNLIIQRKLRKYSQKKMANILGISSTQYSRKENGYSQFKMEEMFTIAKEFDMKIDELFTPRCYQNGNKEW